MPPGLLVDQTRPPYRGQVPPRLLVLFIWGIFQALLGGICLSLGIIGLGLVNLIAGLLILLLAIKISTSTRAKEREAVNKATQQIADIQAELKEIAAIPSFEEFEKADGEIDN